MLHTCSTTLIPALSLVKLKYLCLLIFGIYADSSLGNGYRLPPPEIQNIVDAPPLPTITFSPHRDKILFLKRRSLPPLAELARPEEKLAGVRIDGKCNSRSRMWVTAHFLDFLVIIFNIVRNQQCWWFYFYMFYCRNWRMAWHSFPGHTIQVLGSIRYWMMVPWVLKKKYMVFQVVLKLTLSNGKPNFSKKYAICTLLLIFTAAHKINWRHILNCNSFSCLMYVNFLYSSFFFTFLICLRSHNNQV